jgi:hypothetical protein
MELLNELHNWLTKNKSYMQQCVCSVKQLESSTALSQVLLKDMLDFAQNENGKFALHRSLTDINHEV